MSVLNEKGVEYDVTYIDLRNKPDWFLEISPTGKVPVLQIDDETVLFESAVIMEYLDEAHAPHYMPETALGKAYNRMWYEFVTGLYGLVGRPFRAGEDAASKAETLKTLKDRLLRLEAEVTGPLFNGDGFSLVDATAAPPLMRLQWGLDLHPDVDVLSETPKVKTWMETLLAMESVKTSVPPEVEGLYKERLRNPA